MSALGMLPCVPCAAHAAAAPAKGSGWVTAFPVHPAAARSAHGPARLLQAPVVGGLERLARLARRQVVLAQLRQQPHLRARAACARSGPPGHVHRSPATAACVLYTVEWSAWHRDQIFSTHMHLCRVA